MHILYGSDRVFRLTIAQKDSVGVRVIRMVAVHTHRLPARAIEIAAGEEPSWVQEKDCFSESPIREENSKLL